MPWTNSYNHHIFVAKIMISFDYFRRPTASAATSAAEFTVNNNKNVAAGVGVGRKSRSFRRHLALALRRVTVRKAFFSVDFLTVIFVTVGGVLLWLYSARTLLLQQVQQQDCSRTSSSTYSILNYWWYWWNSPSRCCRLKFRCDWFTLPQYFIGGCALPLLYCLYSVWLLSVRLSLVVMYKITRQFQRRHERKEEATQQGAGPPGSTQLQSVENYQNGSVVPAKNGYTQVGGAEGGFSESSSFETHEHYERKVQRLKRSRPGGSSGRRRQKDVKETSDREKVKQHEVMSSQIFFRLASGFVKSGIFWFSHLKILHNNWLDLLKNFGIAVLKKYAYLFVSCIGSTV